MSTFKSHERDSAVKVNGMISQLDCFAKTYYSNAGTCIVLLTQLNNTGAVKLKSVEDNSNPDSNGEKQAYIDGSVFRQYHALIEKSHVSIVLYSNPKMRLLKKMNVHIVKLRNGEVPVEHVRLAVDFKYSKVGGNLKSDDYDEVKGEELTKNLDKLDEYEKQIKEKQIIEIDDDFVDS